MFPVSKEADFRPSSCCSLRLIEEAEVVTETQGIKGLEIISALPFKIFNSVASLWRHLEIDEMDNFGLLWILSLLWMPITPHLGLHTSPCQECSTFPFLVCEGSTLVGLKLPGAGDSPGGVC